MSGNTKTLQIETNAETLRLVVLADDMTGALDTGVQFAKRGACVSLVLPGECDLPLSEQVAVINTETRHALPEEAYRITRLWAEKAAEAGVPHLYVKTDSALRGNIGPALAGALDGFGVQNAVFVPAYPGMDRITRGGCQYVNGIPIAESVFGQDPVNPVRCSRVRDLIAWHELRVAEVPKNVPLPDPDEPTVCIMDAETDEDLRQISAELRSKGKLALTAGCAAFSQALIREIGLPYQRENIPRVVPPLLVVCGSLNPITHRQIQYGVRQGAWLCTVKSSSLLAEGASEPQINAVIARMRTGVNILIDTDGSVVGEDPVRTAGLIASGMGQLVRKLMERPESGEYTLMIIGGDTLMAYLEQENASDLQLEGEAAPGVVVFHFFNGGRKIRMLSKSGGFGTETLLTDVITDVEPERARS